MPSPSTSTPHSTPATTSTSNSAPTNSSTPISTPSTDPFIVISPAGPCAFTPTVATGEITWLQDGQLRAVADGGQPTCLIGAVTGAGPVSWTSDAQRALLDPATTTNVTGTKPTGFDADNLSVSLSAPTGSATIGVDPASHRLLHRGSNGAVTDISFLAQTDEAIYHPSGKRIAAVGTDANGAYGIWLSSNTGADPKQILSVEDPTKPVTDLSFSADGSILRFIHGFVHELVISNLQLFEVGQADRQEADLVLSKVDEDEAWTTGPCDATGTVLMAGASLGQQYDIRTAAGSPFAGSSMTVQPVGWLAASTLVIAARSTGCSGPADLWIWSVGGGFHQVAHDAVSPSVRIPRGPFTDLPDVIEQQAPG